MLLELSWKFTDSWQAFVSGKGFYDFAYEINGRDDYTNDVLEEYEKEMNLEWVDPHEYEKELAEKTKGNVRNLFRVHAQFYALVKKIKAL